MTKYRHQLPQLERAPFITDGGLETTLIYHDGVDLPHFAAFVLLDDPERKPVLDRLQRPDADRPEEELDPAGEAERASRLALSDLVAKVLGRGLGLLGIEVLEKM